MVGQDDCLLLYVYKSFKFEVKSMLGSVYNAINGSDQNVCLPYTFCIIICIHILCTGKQKFWLPIFTMPNMLWSSN